MSERSSPLGFYVTYAARSLQRSGQRGVLAIVCVAFGVLSLVGLQFLAAMVDDALLADPTEQLSGDLHLARDGAAFTPNDLAVLDRLVAEGTVEAWTPVAPIAASFLREDGNGRVYLVNHVQGVDPAAYPLAGPLRLRDGRTLAATLTSDQDAVVTRDLAGSLGLAPGDRITLAGQTGGGSTRFTVRGIAEQVPNREGNTILLSLDGARRAMGTDAVVAAAFLRTPDGETLAPRMEAAGWTATLPTPRNDEIARVFGFMLPAAGLLGLLLGGIGVANTMQVVLSRRIPEVAALKTLGYRQRDLLALFGLETAMLGVIGGVLGVLGGLAVAFWLRGVLMSALPFLLDVQVFPSVLLGGFLAGVVSAVLFGLVAIVRTSAVRPAVLLRQLPITTKGKARLTTLGLYAVLFVLFGVLSTLLMGSAREGFGVLAGGLVGLGVFGGVMVLLLLLTVRVPMPGSPLLRMARRNLRHRPFRATAALVAVFAGVFVIGLSAMVMTHADDEVDARRMAFGVHNLLVFGAPADHAVLARTVPDVPFESSLLVDVHTRQPSGTGIAALGQLEGRAEGAGWNLDVREGRWPASANEALAPGWIAMQGIGLGDTLVVTRAGTEVPLVISGLYAPKDAGFMTRPRGLIASEATARRIGGEATGALYTLAAPDDAIDATAERLGTALPDAFVLTAPAISDFLVLVYHGLFLLVVAVAGLAFVAGAVLIANAVGLALVERRRELGVLKAVGYTAGQTLRTVLFENALLGLIAGGVGLVAIRIVFFALDRSADIQIPFDPVLGLAMAGFSMLLAMGSAALVAWEPVRVRPLTVLRSE